MAQPIYGKDGILDDVLHKYYHHLIKVLTVSTDRFNQFKMLKGKTLGCWCAPNKCHADIILQVLNQL